MKRIFLALFLAMLSVSIFITPVMAQARLGDFTMRGAASQEMKNDGLVAAHASFPLNSRIKVTNPKNGREIEVVVVERINPSVNRVIDLSATAIQALGMRAGEQVVVTVAAPSRPMAHLSINDGPIVDLQDREEEPPNEAPAPVEHVTVVTPPPAVVVAPPPPVEIKPAPVEVTSTPVSVSSEAITDKALQQPLNITVNTYVNKDDEKSSAKDSPSAEQTEFLAWLMSMTMDAREAREAKEVRETREIRESREAREASAVRESREAREAREATGVRESRESVNSRRFPASANTPNPYRPETSLSEIPQSPPVRASQPVPAYSANPPGSEVSIIEVAPLQPVRPQPVPAPAARVEPAVNIEPAVPVNSRPAATNAPVISEPPIRSEPASAITVRTVTPTAAATAYPPPVKAEDVKIVPGLPDRNSNKTYRLQIAAYSAQDAATRAAQAVKAGGFEAELEFNGSIYRVLVTGIASQDVYTASIKLGSLGYGQIWVRE